MMAVAVLFAWTELYLLAYYGQTEDYLHRRQLQVHVQVCVLSSLRREEQDSGARVK